MVSEKVNRHYHTSRSFARMFCIKSVKIFSYADIVKLLDFDLNGSPLNHAEGSEGCSLPSNTRSKTWRIGGVLTLRNYGQRVERSLRDNFCLLIYNHKKQNGRYLFIGAKSMPYHRSKKVLFLPYLSVETKKSFLVVGGQVGERMNSDFSVSLCPFS